MIAIAEPNGYGWLADGHSRTKNPPGQLRDLNPGRLSSLPFMRRIVGLELP
jgi:hypothetical protein